MLLLLVFAVLGYFAYRAFGWTGAIVDVIAYAVVAFSVRAVGERNRQRAANQILRTKLSDDEKRHLTATAEHQAAMDAHRAQFDPEFRKSRETR